MLGFISSAKTFITLTSLLLLLVDLELCLGQAPPQQAIDICPSRIIEVLSYEDLTINLLQGSSGTGQECSIYLPIQERSWINAATNGYNITKSEGPPIGPCNPAQQDYYVEVLHAAASPIYHCGYSDNPESLFTLYSNDASQVSLRLIAKRPPYRGTNSYYQLLCNVARVVFHEKNGNTVDQVKQKDQIVSHSRYEYAQGQMYPAGINSTLTLAGLKLGSTVRLRIRDFDVDKADSACNDYLKIEGLSYEMRSQTKVCNDTIKLYDTVAISANVSFNFATDGSNNQGKGFHIEYEITNMGCDQDAIELADIEYNSTINGFVAACKDGYWFDGLESRRKTINCRLSDSTWSDATACADINECLISNGGCSDDCINTEGSYLCTCSDLSASLLSDGLTCSSSIGKQSKGTGLTGNYTMTLVGILVPLSVIIILMTLTIGILLRRRRKAANAEQSSGTPIERQGQSEGHIMAPYETLDLSDRNQDQAHEYMRPTMSLSTEQAPQTYEQLNMGGGDRSGGHDYTSVSAAKEQVYVNLNKHE